MIEPDLLQAVKVAWFWDGVSAQPLQNVTLTWEQGIITDITTKHVAGAVDLGNVAIIPAIVNAHAHLEFSHLQQPLTPALPFTNWIGKTIAARNANENVQQSIEMGINESAQAGVGLVGEIVTASNLAYQASQTNLSLLLFREIIGLNRQAIEKQKQIVPEFIKQHRTQHPIGLSPHAPYTVQPDLLQQCINWAREFQLPITMHLAETEAELELMKSGSGELVQMLRSFDLWNAKMIDAGTKPIDYLRTLSQAPHVIIAHGNYLDDEEIRLLAKHENMSVAYCPRTHAFFGHAKHPWQKMLQAGVNVAFGTDGKGSNPDLDLWKEVQFLGKNAAPEQAHQILQMATINGWKAVGNPVSIKVGEPARWTIVRARQFNSWLDFIGADTKVESVNHFGDWKPKWWQADTK